MKYTVLSVKYAITGAYPPCCMKEDDVMYSSTAGATRNGVYRSRRSDYVLPYESKFRFWGQCMDGLEGRGYDRASNLASHTAQHIT